ncbi:hypothetical protein FACS1894152_8220 [Bacilli bacterium]|nr:hypothetical protein FACS1894152_8220 [Bacilli bacterium]
MVDGSKFLSFHSALMSGNAQSEEGIKEALKTAKVSLEKVTRTLKTKSEEIDKRLEENRNLSSIIGFDGTPAMIVGEEFIPGYVEAGVIIDKLR